MDYYEAAQSIVASGVTEVVTKGTPLPLCGMYNTGRANLIAGSKFAEMVQGGSCDLRIVDGADDVMIVEGGGFSTASPLTIGYSEAFYDGAFRWRNSQIPKGAIVTNAYIEFVCNSDWASSGVELLFNITGDDADDSAQLIGYDDYVARSKTSASVAFTFPHVGIGVTFQTPELKTIIQELIDRSGYHIGSALSLFLNAPGWPGKEDVAQVRDYDSYPLEAAVLHIEWTFASVYSTVIAANGDDAKVFVLDSSFEISPEGSMIQMGNANDGIYWGLFRWDGLAIPQGASILNAYVILTSADDYANETCRIKITADASDDSPVFADYADVYARESGTEQVLYAVPSTLSGVVYNTPNLASVVQEIIDRPGWVSGNAISLFFKDDGSDAWALRGVKDFGGFPDDAAVLYIEWFVPALDQIDYVKSRILYLETAGGHRYKIASMNAEGTGLVLEVDALETETGIVYQLSRNYSARLLVVSCADSNTGGAWLGEKETVSYSEKVGVFIAKGAAVVIPASGVCNFWIDADNDGDEVSWLFLE